MVAALALILSPVSGMPRTIVALLLALVLPGYALTAAIFPSTTLGVPERLTLTLGLSLASTVLVGLALNLTPIGLARNSWAAALSSLALVGIVMGIVRSSRRGVGTDSWPGVGLGARDALILGVAALLVVGAWGIARAGVMLQPTPGFTQLWLLPSGESNQRTVRLGVSSLEPVSVKYSLEIESGGSIISRWDSIELAPGGKWEATVSLPSGLPNDAEVEAVLYRLDAPGAVYRRAFLRSPQSE